jgi:ubiquinone/menaquinone biosynthesis C-methylase UbiE/uncharacterized protein YbaR (Trm112 family)
MKNNLMDILVCPRCFGKLKLKAEASVDGQIMQGKLSCLNCKLDFAIEDGVPAFGMKAGDKQERLSEMAGENEWVYNANELRVHIDFARNSSEIGEIMVQKLEKRMGLERMQERPKVLDIGAGWGGFQSWQFAKHGFEAVAVELCPEFVLATDCVTRNTYFERIVADCTILPLRDASFDIVFCKEVIHHISDPMVLLDEMWRVSRPDGVIAIREPCASIFRKWFPMGADKAMEVGITHHSYTYGEYARFFNRVASQVEIAIEAQTIDSATQPVISFLQKPIIAISRIPGLGNSVTGIHVTLAGGSVELIGIKNGKYQRRKTENRDVIPLDMRNLNHRQIEFYRTHLIPEVLRVFSDTHSRYRKNNHSKP